MNLKKGFFMNISEHNTAISCGGGKAYEKLVEKQFKPAGAEK